MPFTSTGERDELGIRRVAMWDVGFDGEQLDKPRGKFFHVDWPDPKRPQYEA